MKILLLSASFCLLIFRIAQAQPLNPGNVGGSQTLCPGGNPAAFTSEAAASGGTGTLSYQWQSSTVLLGDYTEITGATQATYDLGAQAASGVTYYRRRVTDTFSPPRVAYSDTLTVTVGPGNAITTQPTSADVGTGRRSKLKVAARGQSLTYQWQKSLTETGTFQNIDGATRDTLVFNNASLADTGYYRVVVSGTCGSALTSSVARLRVFVITRRDPSASLGSLKLYPNPVRAELNIELEKAGPYTLRILNLQGQEVAAATFVGSTHRLSTAALPAGTYLLEVSGTSGLATQRIVVQ
jgi:hypothetical protein